ncbi:MAG TPA: zinc-dependent metalloprotease [Acidimicrobiales bacterium]|nr:zinc-dependent metalloprotease [Acidimicrobiales bacterium]
MSESGPGGDNPFEGLPMFRDLARLFAGQGPINWDIARQIAVWTATEGEAEPNVDPVDRMRFDELLRVADLHVTNATGLSTTLGGGLLSAAPTTRADWALKTLQAWRPFLERLATAVSAAGESEGAGPDPATQLLGDLGRVVGPVLLGMQSGYMVGHLGRRALGQYDLPVPRGASNELLVVPANLNAFADEWSIPGDDLRLWVLLQELTHHAVLGRPHVRARLEALVDDYVGRFDIDANALEGSFADIDPSDPTSFAKALSPETLLGIVQTPAQREVATRIETLLAAVAGYVDHVLDTVGQGLVGTHGRISEALRRRRVESSEGTRFAERLLGLQLGAAQYEKGHAFVAGVVERAGEEGLSRLWVSERELPTPSELDAPGLWLARIDLPD